MDHDYDHYALFKCYRMVCYNLLDFIFVNAFKNDFIFIRNVLLKSLTLVNMGTVS